MSHLASLAAWAAVLLALASPEMAAMVSGTSHTLKPNLPLGGVLADAITGDDAEGQDASSSSPGMPERQLLLLLLTQAEQLASQGSAIEHLKAAEGQLRSDNGRLSTAVEELRYDNGRLSTAVEELRSDNGRLSTAVEELRSDNGRLSTAVEELRSDNGRLSTAVEELRSDNGRLSTAVEELRSDNGRLSTALTEVTEGSSGQECGPCPKPSGLQDRTASQQPPDSHHGNQTTTTPTNETHDEETSSFTSLNDVTAARGRRADDAGPLEAAVDQLGQRVAGLDTDLQAFRALSATDLQALRDADRQQEQQLQDARASTFVHWGSSQCGGSSQLVYAGVVGGSGREHSGAASNYLCLSLQPVLGARSPTSHRALLYGAEYETYDSRDDSDPVCAVCRSTYSTTVMIPGTSECTPGWQQQYSGYLMADASHIPAASEYICVDSGLESRTGSARDEEGRQLYFTFTVCGTLPCGPYAADRMVTCAVCSR